MKTTIQPRVYTSYNNKNIEITNFIEQFIITTSLSKHMIELYLVLKIDNRNFNLILDELSVVRIVLTQPDLKYKELNFNITSLRKSENSLIDKMNRTDHLTGIDSLMTKTIVNMKSVAYSKDSVINILEKVLIDNKINHTISDTVKALDNKQIEYISPIQSLYKDIEYLSNQVYDILTYRNKDGFIIEHFTDIPNKTIVKEISSDDYEWEMIKGKDTISAIGMGVFGYKFTEWDKINKEIVITDKKIIEQEFSNKPMFQKEFQTDGVIFNQTTIKLNLKDETSLDYDVGMLIKFSHGQTHLSGYYVISNVVDKLNKEKWVQEVYMSQIVSINKNRSLF